MVDKDQTNGPALEVLEDLQKTPMFVHVAAPSATGIQAQFSPS